MNKKDPIKKQIVEQKQLDLMKIILKKLRHNNKFK